MPLDGGGIRGLSSIIILGEIMRSMEDGNLEYLRPCEYFDFITGAGMGGYVLPFKIVLG